MKKLLLSPVVTALALTLATGSVGAAQPVAAQVVATQPVAAQHVSAADRAYRDLMDHGPDAKVMTVAHRAQWREAPENSLPAITAAFDHGAEVVEIDLQLTKDGHPVLMHDDTVDRTTSGSGKVADLTLAQIKELRLKKGLGGAQAPLTDERVPTLAEAMPLIKNRGLANLDKGWNIREELYQVLTETRTVRNGLFKSSAPVEEVQAFRAKHPDALYMHVVSDDNIDHLDGFGDDQPVAYEVIFDSDEDAIVRKPVLDRMRSTGRVWINSMWFGLADHYTDERSLIDPARGWGALVDTFGASMLQTDNVETLESWLRTGRAEKLPADSVRVQGEDFRQGGEGVAYHDLDAQNRGGNVARLSEGVDVCDQDGAVDVCWIRGGEWITYDIDIRKSGYYEVSARVSSPYQPAGTYRLAFDGGSPSDGVAVQNTTSHSAFFLQPSGIKQYFKAGRHHMTFTLDSEAYQNFNLDYFQLDKVKNPS
ncbi:glycerophosphodiester phosphodiesterase family protein [Streptomyces sp. 35G-GA-8]|uniref:glycerophosphodiester phosphodiesterase family protein n=1 Tax=Streptomyces sp. 35G-GA-8 TaxID=2939434 RepID=UPI00201F3952|nr:glycerophosphodiester phosphodiesterase family protein [Streptomyces sp. 35G-GA-8]MCL7382097.1 carbohydrate-binding protein [Streptomyces sp. 35G-GA-8]